MMNHIKKAYRYHYITDLINNGGGLSMEYLFEMKVTAIAFEEVGTIGEGKKTMTLLNHCWRMLRLKQKTSQLKNTNHNYWQLSKL
jgi:hypothetical protein